MFEFEWRVCRTTKGSNREPGSRKIPVREFICDRVPRCIGASYRLSIDPKYSLKEWFGSTILLKSFADGMMVFCLINMVQFPSCGPGKIQFLGKKGQGEI